MKCFVLLSLLGLSGCYDTPITGLNGVVGSLGEPDVIVSVYKIEDRDNTCYVSYRPGNGSHSIACVKKGE